MKGSLFIILSALAFSTYGVWSKTMVGAFGPYNQAWTRALLLLFVLIPFGVVMKQFRKVEKKDWIWFLVVSFSGALNQAPYYFGFEHLPVGTATLLFYMMLVLGAFIIGKLFFKEQLTSVKYISLSFALLGLFIIYQFGLTVDQLVPAIFTMIAGLMGASIVVFSKKLSSHYSETQILTYLFIAMLFSNLLLSTWFDETLPSLTNTSVWMAQLGYTTAMVVANGLVIAGFKYIEPSIGGLLGLLEVLFAAFLGILLFHDVLTTQLLIGSILIIIGAAFPDALAITHRPKNSTSEVK